MPGDELATLKRVVTILGAFGQLLARMNREAAESSALCHELQRTQIVVNALKQTVQTLARASLESWESGYG